MKEAVWEQESAALVWERERTTRAHLEGCTISLQALAELSSGSSDEGSEWEEDKPRPWEEDKPQPAILPSQTPSALSAIALTLAGAGLAMTPGCLPALSTLDRPQSL